jgi:hypothetical protein
MCKYLTYFYTCGYHGSARFRTALCADASDPSRCRDTDRGIVVPYVCKYCATNQRRGSHPKGTLMPTPPPSPESEDEKEVVWIVQSRCELFHRQEGFKCYDPFAADREKKGRVKRLRMLPGTEVEPIDLKEGEEEVVGDSPTTATSSEEEDPFGPEGLRPQGVLKKWSLSFLRQKKKPVMETSRCCVEAGGPTYGIQGYAVDDRCESSL